MVVAVCLGVHRLHITIVMRVMSQVMAVTVIIVLSPLIMILIIGFN